jgi:nucleotide-binding universal stress UspA family protein
MLMRNPFARPRPVNKQAAGNVLIASEGRRFTAAAIDLAVQMARAGNGHVRVMTVARLWGTSFGLPNPGLRPSRREMAEQEENVSWAISRIEDAGLSADGHIVTTRHPSKSILNEAKRQNCDAIVMGADRRRNWLIGSMMWSQEPYRVRGRTTIPVHLVGPAD